MLTRKLHLEKFPSFSSSLNTLPHRKFKSITNGFSNQHPFSTRKNEKEKGLMSGTFGTSFSSWKILFNNEQLYSFSLISRNFATSKKSDPKAPKPVSEEKLKKKEDTKSYLQKIGRSKPLRRSKARTQQLEERKKTPIANDTILLLRVSSELDKVDALWGIRRNKEGLPVGSVTSPFNKPRSHKSENEEETSEEKPRLQPPPRISRTELKELLDSKQPVTLIDLREISLHENEPPLPGAHSFTILRKIKNGKSAEERSGFLRDALKLSPEQFKAKFKRPVFGVDDNIVFYSSIGIRSEEVTNYAISLGFKNSKSLYGGVRLWNKYYSS